jgi:hypothetical protein
MDAGERNDDACRLVGKSPDILISTRSLLSVLSFVFEQGFWAKVA